MLKDMYGISAETLRKHLNVDYYADLLAVGYKKNKSILTPKVLEKFIELYGAPVDHLNLKES